MRLAPNIVLSGTLQKAPSGYAGAFNTLRLMREIIDASKTNPAIIQAAHSIIFLTPERDEYAEVCALFEYVRDQIRYVPDVLGVETITAPETTLIRRTGDCDDQTVLLCSLCESVGFPTRLVMTGYNSQEYEHVYCQVFANNQWINCDPIMRNFQLGDANDNPQSIYIEPR